MFIAMNRFKVIPVAQADFERVWTTRDTHLREVPGFVEFHLLRGPEREDHVLFASHTIWRSRTDFEAWTKSEAFRLPPERGTEQAALSRASRVRRVRGHPDGGQREVLNAGQNANASRDRYVGKVAADGTNIASDTGGGCTRARGCSRERRGKRGGDISRWH